MTDIYVSNAAQLQAALSQASGGETIILKSGNYGELNIVGESYSKYVTIVSEKPLGAHFTSVTVSNSDYVKIDSVHVDSPSNGGAGGRIVEVIDGSQHVQFVNSEVNGKVDSDYTGFFGLYTNGNVKDVTFANNYVHDVKVGAAFFNASDLTISGNTVDHIAGDSYKFSGVNGALIEGNRGATHIYDSPGEHFDFMQFQHDSSDIIVRGNISLPETRSNIQGIFFNNGTYSNVVVEYNVIASSQLNGIYVSDGSNMVARNNTLINIAGGGSKSTIVRGFDQSYNNIESTYTSATGSGSNLKLQNTDPNGDFYLGDYFTGATKGLGMTLEDLLPKSGTLAETKGAIGTVEAFLSGETPVSKPAPEPDPEPEPEPIPQPEPEPDPDPQPTPDTTSLDGAVFYLEGDHEITGAGNVIEYAHDTDWALKSGTVALTFNADSVTGSRGLFSKDASYFQGGGHHFTSYIVDGVLTLRFQDGDSSKTFTVKGIKAHTDYDLQFSFGDGTITVWLDGAKVGEAAFDMSWETNAEFLQLGGNGWGSDSGEAGFTHVFDGTISDVVIAEGVKTPAEIQALIAGEPVTEPEPEPEPTPDPVEPDPVEPDPVEPAPEPEPEPTPGALDDAVYHMTGSRRIDSAEDVLQFAPSDDLALSSATIALTFNADSVKGNRGLVSKDAKYFQGGGHHFTSYIDDGTLIVRFQDGNSSRLFQIDGIKAGVDYDFQISFGDGVVTAMLNGKVFGQTSFDMSWETNAEYMQIGANGWASKTGDDAFTHVFDGTISDVVIVEGVKSPAEIQAMLDGAPAPDPTPDPVEPDPVEPDPVDPDPVVTTDPPILYLGGSHEFAAKQDVLEYAHNSALELPVATAMLTFNADTVSGQRGLLSKDASYFEGGGHHFTSYIDNGTLIVRFQDGDSSKTFKIGGIKANTDYDLQINFGDGQVSASLNGVAFGTAAFDTSWATNTEHLQIGANGWSTGTGEAGFTHVFDGTISDVVIVTGNKTPAEMEEIKAQYAPTGQADYSDITDLLVGQELSGFTSVSDDIHANLAGAAQAPDLDPEDVSDLWAALLAHSADQDYYSN